MDYESLGVQELRAESQRRGLGTARSKADLIQRLTDHDAQQGSTVEEDFADDAALNGDPAEPTRAADEDATPAPHDAPKPAPPADPAPAPIRSFRKTFQAEPDGPDEETHLAYRETTLQAAIEAGLIPRGDARLAEAKNGVWVYEISVKQVP